MNKGDFTSPRSTTPNWEKRGQPCASLHLPTRRRQLRNGSISSVTGHQRRDGPRRLGYNAELFNMQPSELPVKGSGLRSDSVPE